jgi:hypothetical protein
VPDRKFPLSPTSARDLRVGDFWAVTLSDGTLGCLQVTDLRKSGRGTLKLLIAGVVDWRGSHQPNHLELSGRRVLIQGLTRIEAFTKTGSQILGNSDDTIGASELASNFRDFEVGTVHHVWGWSALPQIVERELGGKALGR